MTTGKYLSNESKPLNKNALGENHPSTLNKNYFATLPETTIQESSEVKTSVLGNVGKPSSALLQQSIFNMNEHACVNSPPRCSIPKKNNRIITIEIHMMNSLLCCFENNHVLHLPPHGTRSSTQLQYTVKIRYFFEK